MSAAQWPTVTVEISFHDDTLDLNGVLILDDTDFGILNTATLAGPLWTDVTADVRSFRIARGRTTSLDRFPAGTCTIELDDNTDGRYDPDNGNAGLNQPDVPVRVTATWNSITYPLFYGYADSWTPTYTPGKFSYQSCTLVASDAMNILASFVPAAPSGSQGAGETADLRIGRILDNAGFDTTLRLFDTGWLPLAATTLAQSAADDIQAAVDAEIGQWYINPSGQVQFENRYARLGNARVSSFVFTDQSASSSALLYSDVVRTNDRQIVRNLVQGQRSGGTLQQVSDTASQRLTHGPRTFNSTTLELQTDPAVATWCALMLYLYSLPETRVESVTFEPLGDPTNLWPAVLGLQFSQCGTVQINPPQGSQVNKTCFIEGVSHEVTTSPQNWVTTFQTSAATRFVSGWFLLDDATYGILDTSTLGATIG